MTSAFKKQKKSCLSLSTLKILAILLGLQSPLNAQHPADFVWKDAVGSGRQQKVLFRKSFELSKIPEEASIKLFADSRYHLYVNETHINFGPSRFYQDNPEYDSHSIGPYLKTGKNVIAVEVLSNGTESYQVPLSIGGFIAWGNITDPEEGSISLNTPGNWKMKSVNSMNPEALRFSFACSVLEDVDFRKEPADWKNTGFNDSDWKKTVSIENQNYWGAMKVRTIPHLSQDEITPLLCTGIYLESNKEDVLSFFVKAPDRTNLEYNTGESMIGYTYIYSPKEQELELGTWWGDYYLNGEGPLKVSSRDPQNPVRQNRIFSLRKGWNYLFVNYHAIWGGWEFNLAIPKNSKLYLSAHKDSGLAPSFKTLSGLERAEGQKHTAKLKDEQAINKKLLKKLNWVEQTLSTKQTNPARELVWKQPKTSINLKTNDFQTGDFTLDSPRFFTFDLGRKTLGRVYVEIDAPEGTIIEIGWSEDLNDQQLPWLFKRMQINSGCRFITNGQQSRYETFKPYGIRHLIAKITPPDNEAVELKETGVIEQVYPYEKRGSFECSDPMLNRIWELGWRTLRVCSEDSYIDTPFRERGLYAGDALPEYAITLATSGDSRLMKKSLLLFQDMYREEMTTGRDNRHNDFILKTLLELYWHHKYTGDVEFTRQLYPNYKGYLDLIEKKKKPEGYYQVGKVFLEWTRINKTADLTAYQALLYGTMKCMEEMASDLGYTSDSESFSKRASDLKKVINELFWDPQTGAFYDGYENGNIIDHHYPISSYYPLLFDVIHDDIRKSRVIDYLDKKLLDIGEETRNRKTTPYSAFYLFEALYQHEEAGIAERFMKQYWSRMIHQGDDTSWENFDIGGGKNGDGQGTASHAWSGHPTYFLSSRVLGVDLGFRNKFNHGKVMIQPQAENIHRAKGSIPHPSGTIYVDWKIKNEKLIFKLTLPEDLDFELKPKGRLARYELIPDISFY